MDTFQVEAALLKSAQTIFAPKVFLQSKFIAANPT